METCNLNSSAKAVTYFLLYVFGVVGLGLIAFGLYIIFVPWNSQQINFYEACGICLVLFGFCFTLITTFGYLGVANQIKRLGGGYTGRTAIAVFLVFSAALFVAFVFLYIYTLVVMDHFTSTIDKLDSGSTASYSEEEKVLLHHFNNIFFTGTTDCQSKFVLCFNNVLLK
jgi:hypothetical protein